MSHLGTMVQLRITLARVSACRLPNSAVGDVGAEVVPTLQSDCELVESTFGRDHQDLHISARLSAELDQYFPRLRSDDMLIGFRGYDAKVLDTLREGVASFDLKRLEYAREAWSIYQGEEGLKTIFVDEERHPLSDGYFPSTRGPGEWPVSPQTTWEADKVALGMSDGLSRYLIQHCRALPADSPMCRLAGYHVGYLNECSRYGLHPRHFVEAQQLVQIADTYDLHDERGLPTLPADREKAINDRAAERSLPGRFTLREELDAECINRVSRALGEYPDPMVHPTLKDLLRKREAPPVPEYLRGYSALQAEHSRRE